MRNIRAINMILVAVIIGVAIYGGYRVLYTANHLGEAYAAWDTGTLLIEYMEQHDDRWPESWDDLLSILEGESAKQIPLRGASAGDVEYAQSLRETVAVDWSFDPANAADASPVTRLDGSAFPVVWEGAEPNEMIREYLLQRSSTRPIEVP